MFNSSLMILIIGSMQNFIALRVMFSMSAISPLSKLGGNPTAWQTWSRKASVAFFYFVHVLACGVVSRMLFILHPFLLWNDSMRFTSDCVVCPVDEFLQVLLAIFCLQECTINIDCCS